MLSLVRYALRQNSALKRNFINFSSSKISILLTFFSRVSENRLVKKIMAKATMIFCAIVLFTSRAIFSQEIETTFEFRAYLESSRAEFSAGSIGSSVYLSEPQFIDPEIGLSFDHEIYRESIFKAGIRILKSFQKTLTFTMTNLPFKDQAIQINFPVQSLSGIGFAKLQAPRLAGIKHRPVLHFTRISGIPMLHFNRKERKYFAIKINGPPPENKRGKTC